MMLSWLFSDPLPVGADAPEFSVADDSGRTVTLSALRGTLRGAGVLPGRRHAGLHQAALPVPRRLEPGDRPRRARCSASIHKTRGTTPISERNSSFPFPLLVDERQKVAEAYHANGLIVKRTVYLIGRDGKILFARRGMPSPAEVLAAVK